MVLLAWGRSHRTPADGELIRWGRDLARVEGVVGSDTIEVAIVRSGSGSAGRKRIRVNGLGRRAAGLAGLLRVVLFAPEEMLLIAGSPSLRRAVIDQLAASGSPAYADALSTYGRTLQQRNSLLRAIREEGASRAELRFWDGAFLDAGGAIVAERRRLLEVLAGPLAAAHAEIAPDEAATGRLTLGYVTNAPPLPGESPRDALARRLAETAEKEVWNGSTLVGPHRDDLVFELDGRDLATFASRGQQRTAILALKLAELDVMTTRDGARRSSCSTTSSASSTRSAVRTSSGGSRRCPRRSSPRRRSTTSTPSCARSRRPGRCASIRTAPDCSAPTSVPGRERSGRRGPVSPPRRRPMVRLGDLIPDAARALGLEDELRLSRAIATFEALVAERVPAAAGACRVVRLEGFALDVEADAPIVAQELRLRGPELLTAFAAAPGGVGARELRVHVRRGGPRV